MSDVEIVTQLQLPDLHFPELPNHATIGERFAAFHGANPHVYEELKRLARDLVLAGHNRISIKMLFEVVRWSGMKTRGDDTYKLNNDFTSRYARALADNDVLLRDVFEFRQLKTP